MYATSSSRYAVDTGASQGAKTLWRLVKVDDESLERWLKHHQLP